MSEAESALPVVREWLAKADNDLKTAAHTLKLGAECPTDTVCFHAQQCVEKYLKALLTWKGIIFPKTHDIQVVLGLLPTGTRPPLTQDECDELTDYATVARYPGDYGAIPLADARRAVAAARRVRKHIRALLPPKALRRARR